MDHATLMTFFMATQVLFAFAFGSCAGSLINVLAYRMPKGMSVVTPASRCPSCGHVLTWRENIPVVGWLILRGKCRFCKAKISPEYPIVEAIVGSLFVLFYVLWYLMPTRETLWGGIDWSDVRPEWALNGFGQTWPVFVALMMLVASLVAMTIIDARTFTIPLVLTWVPAVVAALAHTGWAAWMSFRDKSWRYTSPDDWWAMATPGPDGWPILIASFGAIAGLLVANVLLATGLLTRSFHDYDEWEAKALAEAGHAPEPQAEEQSAVETGAEEVSEDKPEPLPDPGASRRRRLTAGSIAAGMIGGMLAMWLGGGSPILGGLVGLLLVIPLCGLAVRAVGLSKPAPVEEGDPAELWIQYPHARREVVREALFLAPCIAGAIGGWFLGHRLGAPWTLSHVTLEMVPEHPIPLWLSVLGGVALGYVAGGGIVWGIRILGSLAFGKEAMGLGDVHLLAAVGACVGWIDSVLAFFLAPFMALYIVLVQACWSGDGRRAMPYGPYLAAATLAVLLFKTPIEAGLTSIFGSPIPLNFP